MSNHGRRRGELRESWPAIAHFPHERTHLGRQALEGSPRGKMEHAAEGSNSAELKGKMNHLTPEDSWPGRRAGSGGAEARDGNEYLGVGGRRTARFAA